MATGFYRDDTVPTFDIGDRVRNNGQGTQTNAYKTGRVTEVYDNGRKIKVRYDDGTTGKGKLKFYDLLEELDKVEVEEQWRCDDDECPCEKGYRDETVEKLIKPKKTIMQNLVSKIKNLKLSPNDRVLRKHGLENECGEPTSTAQQMMLDELATQAWATRRDELAANLIELDKEEKGE